MLFLLLGVALGCNRSPSSDGDGSKLAPQPIRETIVGAAKNSQGAAPQPLDARQGILDAFDSFPLVALSEAHGLQEEINFLDSLIRHPAFPNKVNAIVLEAGNARYQDVIDRYVAGDEVARAELQPVWRDHTCCALGPMDSYHIEQFFTAVRVVNQQLPMAQRLRVLAGDPPIDWSKVRKTKDLTPWVTQRDTHYAEIVENEVLAKNRKALLIMGGVHLSRAPLPGADPKAGVMLQIVESKHPGKTFVVGVHEGFGRRTSELEPRLAEWPRPSLALVRGTWLENLEGVDEGLDVFFDAKTGKRATPADRQKESKDRPDAILYLGPRAELTMEPRPVELFRDDSYFQELNRRHQLAHGRPLDRAELLRPRPQKWVENFPAGAGDVLQKSPDPADGPGR
jgi:hypothetical protein